MKDQALRRKNRLGNEKSPYLLQHQHNPVDWYPWGDDAFTRARQENKPIFLSIGYSTCHWCHVMERESFENDQVAHYLNEHFVSIKVDREERPDVDKIYMTFVQAATGSGGWPLNVFLTPDLKPFFGGTYFPPDGKQGRPGFLHILHELHRVWLGNRQDIDTSADQVQQQLGTVTALPAADATSLSTETLRQAGSELKKGYDPAHGGFGHAPKFPQPSHPRFLLRHAARFQDEEARKMVLHTCERMAAGGIHDQLGGGFSRYSVDAQWLVPHFEKMLYDNAQLAELYLDAFLVSGDQRHARVARGILDYVLRDMTHSEGGFFSAEDADSEGHEGKFYCWTLDEVRQLLAPEEFEVARRHFGLTSQGNFVDHSHPSPLPNQNVLSVAEPAAQDAHPLLLRAVGKMFAARSKRVRPHRDDKVLTSWNGLMLGAFARGYSVLGEERYRQAAEKNLAFLRANLWDDREESLSHRWRDGARDSVQLLDSYAFLLQGVLQLYEAVLSPDHLVFSVQLAEAMLRRFHDPERGGFWQSAAPSHELILRLKEDYDGAEPSGNSVAALSLLKLGKITGNEAFTSAAQKTLALFAGRLRQLPHGVSFMLHALDSFLEEPRRAVIAGEPAREETRALLKAVHSVYQPNKVVLGTLGPVEEFARTLPPPETASLYLCTGAACKAPTSDPREASKLMSQA